jgi:HEAT repeat protein
MESPATWFCPQCWSEIARGEKTCPRCGAGLEALDSASYESKLIQALEHRMADRRLIAAHVLGQIGLSSAVPALIKLAERGDDPYRAAEAVSALARIGGPEAEAFLLNATRQPSVLVRQAAREAARRW